MKVLFKSDLSALKALKNDILERDNAMLGGPNGEGSRPPDGDDYNELYNDVMYLLSRLGL